MCDENEARIDAVRAFNRFFTGHVGALDESMLESGFTLAEARLLYELDRSPRVSAGELAQRLRMDPAYLSRLIKGFRKRGLLLVERDPEDGRRQCLSLNAAGKAAFAPLAAGSRARVAAILGKLSAAEQDRLIASMEAITELLGEGQGVRPLPVLRAARAGETAQVLQQAVGLFRQEQGWGGGFEAELMASLAGFLSRRAAGREGLFLIECSGRIGGAFLLLDEGSCATCPLFFVEPGLRGRGLGRQLLAEAAAAALAAGFTTLRVHSEAGLEAAESLLAKEGFRMEREETFDDYGRPLLRRVWERRL